MRHFSLRQTRDANNGGGNNDTTPDVTLQRVVSVACCLLVCVKTRARK